MMIEPDQLVINTDAPSVIPYYFTFNVNEVMTYDNITNKSPEWPSNKKWHTTFIFKDIIPEESADTSATGARVDI